MIHHPVERVEFRNTKLGLVAFAFPSEERPGWFKVIVSLETRDRETGIEEPFSTHHYRRRSSGRTTPPSRARLARWVRDCAKAMLLHELDEALHVDGVRVFDPHMARRSR